MLYQYNPDLSYYFGHRYKVSELEEGYMAGGGYILSRQAVKNFVQVAQTNPSQCFINGTVEDWEMGRCLTHNAVFLMDHDEKNQKRFFPLSIDEHLVPKEKVTFDWWYRERAYFEVEQGDLDCCSETAIAFHYISPPLMYELEYFIYKVHPFGVETIDKLPEKLLLNEIDEFQ
jgi:glycoprotein-N-acetylgalactosamine 3-beta-galactosyltransferase